MRIKLVVATSDKEYLHRFEAIMQERYKGRLKLSLYTDFDAALEKANEIKADIILAEEDIVPEQFELPRRCILALLVSDKGIDSIDGKPAICKYQSVQALYSDIMAVYSIQAESNGIKASDDITSEKTIITFYPAAGGVGCSTVAAAFAIYLAKLRKKVLYLNLEEFGSSDIFFHGEGKDDFGKVIYALEIDNSSTRLRIESAMRKDDSGVYYFSPPPSALDMQDMTEDRIDYLFEQLGNSSLIDIVIVDMTFGFGKIMEQMLMRSDTVVFVSDGSIQSNTKLIRISNALEMMAKHNDGLLDCRTLLMYNRFSSKTGHKLENSIFAEVGGIGRIENGSPEELIRLISTNGAFANIL